MRRWLQNLAEEDEIIIYHKKTQITKPIMQSLKVETKLLPTNSLESETSVYFTILTPQWLPNYYNTNKLVLFIKVVIQFTVESWLH